jgi:hypothetical protein
MGWLLFGRNTRMGRTQTRTNTSSPRHRLDREYRVSAQSRSSSSWRRGYTPMSTFYFEVKAKTGRSCLH